MTGFDDPAWWSEHAEDDLGRRCGELRESFAGYDLVPLVEQHTGVRFDARAVELCVLRWAAPHGIRVTGTRFLTDLRYDADRVLNIAVHELLHPPWPKGHQVRDRLDALAADPFLAARFAARDPAAGYNTWASYAEEDAAQALDQYLNTQLGRNSRGDPVTRWATADGGMHVLALLLYDTLQRGGFAPAAGSYADFLDRTLSDGHTWPDDLHARYFELTAVRLTRCLHAVVPGRCRLIRPQQVQRPDPLLSDSVYRPSGARHLNRKTELTVATTVSDIQSGA